MKLNNLLIFSSQVNGQNGFVPANYVKEIQPTVVSVEVKKPVVVKDVRKVRLRCA